MMLDQAQNFIPGLVRPSQQWLCPLWRHGQEERTHVGEGHEEEEPEPEEQGHHQMVTEKAFRLESNRSWNVGKFPALMALTCLVFLALDSEGKSTRRVFASTVGRQLSLTVLDNELEKDT